MTRESTTSTVVAETVAIGLHSLAQPLTAAQWQIEFAAANCTPQQSNALSGALAAMEAVVAQLDFLREVIRPFRAHTQFAMDSLRNTLAIALASQIEILDHDGVDVSFALNCSEGFVEAPSGFLQRIAYMIFDLMRSHNASSVRFEISESVEMVKLFVSWNAAKTETQTAGDATVSKLKAYVEVLGGTFSMSATSSALSLSLPKVPDSLQ
jgi:hypothetical protein